MSTNSKVRPAKNMRGRRAGQNNKTGIKMKRTAISSQSDPRNKGKLSKPDRRGGETSLQWKLKEEIARLRESEEKYRNIVELTPAVVYLDHADEEGTNFYISPQVESMLGYPSSAFFNRPALWREMLFPEDSERALATIKETLKNRQAMVEYRLIARDGNVVWVRDTSVLIRDKAGKPKYIQGFLEDVTRHKQAEEALGKSERRLQVFFNQSLDGFFFCDFEEPIEWKHAKDREETLEYIVSKKCFTEVNDALLNQYGQSREAFLKLTTKDVFAHDIEQGRRLLRGLFDKGHLRMETDERTSAGKQVWFEGEYACLYDAQDRITGFFGIQREITDRKNAEQALRESEERYRTLVTGMLDGVYRSTHDGKFVDVNPSMIKMFGYESREEMLALDIKKDLYFAPGDRESLFLDTGQEKVDVFRMRRKDGSEIWVEDHGRYIHDEDGNVVFHEGILRDITERKQAEDALREAETKYRTLVEQLPIMVYVNPANDINSTIYVSPQIEAFLGYTQEEWLADPRNWEKSLHPDDMPRVLKSVAHIDETGGAFDIEYRMIARNGDIVWMRDQATLLRDSEGRPLMWQGLMIDVTERKQAEEALKQSEAFTKSIVENEPECVKIVGAGGRLQYMNPAGLAMIEADSLDSVLDKSVYPIVAPNDRQAFIDLTERVLRGERGSLQFEIAGLKGARRWLETHAVPLYDGEGNVSSLLGLTRDITERKRAEETALATEEKYRSIFENALEGIYQSSPEGRFHTVNPAFAHMLGYDSPQEMIDSITDIARQVYHDASRRADFTRRLEEQGNISGFEYQLRRKDDRLIWVSENARVVRDLAGNVLYYEGLLEDITSRKQNEQRIQIQLQQLNSLHTIENAINSNSDLRTTLEVILREVLAQLKADAASVLLFNKDAHTLDYTAGRGFLSKAIQHTKLRAGEGYAGRIILDRKTIHVPDLTKAKNDRLANALNLAGEDFAAYVGSPLIAKGQVLGVLEIFQRAPLTPDPDWFDFLSTLADQAALAIDNAQLFENLQRTNFDLTLAYDATIEGWSRAMDLRDKETEGHTQRVTNLTVKLARKMGIPDVAILHIRRGALLHDIGKMGIPDSILHKPDKLTPEEWDIMRQHTNYAFQMLTPIAYLKPALDIPRFHHEKWDGTGYPNGLKGGQIPIAARIFAVVDVWDALTTDRSYRRAWSKESAIEYIRNESGKHFDPNVVENFLSIILNE